jgi:hypothetical protein
MDMHNTGGNKKSTSNLGGVNLSERHNSKHWNNN